ncbi:MAG: hypothetical protein AMXMBFR13_00300 [Phycisphaerae bacterium]
MQSLSANTETCTFRRLGETLQLVITGHYSDESQTDLTAKAMGTTYLATDDSVVIVSDNGLIRSTGYGEAILTVVNNSVALEIPVTVQAPAGAGGGGGGVAPAKLNVDPLKITLTGSLPQAQIAINNAGGGTLNWTAAAGDPRILLGTTEGSAPATLLVSAAHFDADFDSLISVNNSVDGADHVDVIVHVRATGKLAIQSRQLCVQLNLLTDLGFQADELRVQSLLSSQDTLAAQAQGEAGFEVITCLEIADASQGQLLTISRTTDDLLIVPAYCTPAQVDAGTMTLDVSAIANAMILTNPYLMILPASERDMLIAKAPGTASYAQLLAGITEALAAEPTHFTEFAVFPEIWTLAMQIGAELLQSEADQIAHALGIRKMEENNVIGSAGSFHLADEPGSDILLVNPTMVFYGVQTDDDRTELVSGKESLVSVGLQWPPVFLTPAVQEPFALGEGIFTIVAYKGFNSGEPGWLNIQHAAGQATYANLIKIAAILLDVAAWCPLDNGDIEHIVEAIADPGIIGIETLAEAGNDWMEFAKKGIEVVHENWDEISLWIWQEWPGDQTVTYLRKVGKLMNAASAALKVLQVVDAANTKIPFFIDLVFARGKLVYQVRQENGVLSAYQRPLAPPTAEVLVAGQPVGLPAEVYVGDVITLQATCYDEHTDTADLEVRWDLQGDGVFDTNWSTSHTAVHTFTQVGNYVVQLEVRDTDGEVGFTVHHLHVEASNGQGTANHVIAFRDNLPWDSNAFEDMMDELGYFPGEGSYEYEILPSSSFSSVVLRPGQDFVIITNDQNQLFYNNLAVSFDRLVRFIENGGTLLWGACDKGWANGSMTQAGIGLPGGVSTSLLYDPTNYVTLTAPLTDGLPPTLTGNYASHEAFINLAPGTTTYTEDTRGLPTLIEYKVGSGTILATGQPLEWGYDRLGSYTIGLLYPRLIRYVFGENVQAESLESNPPKMSRVPAADVHVPSSADRK